MQVEGERPFSEEVMIGPEEQARERPEEPNSELGIGPPGEHAAVGQHRAVGVADEIVEIPSRSWHRVAPCDHGDLEVVIQKQGAGERRPKEERANQCDNSDHGSGPARSRQGPPYKKVGRCRFFAVVRLNVA